MLPSAAFPNHMEGEVSGDMALEAMISNQATLAEDCGSSKYADVCGQHAAMLFAPRMFGACSPVGCVTVSLEGPLAGARTNKVKPWLKQIGRAG